MEILTLTLLLYAVRPDFGSWALPDGTQVTRLIVETKDEHDYDLHGTDMGRGLRADVQLLAGEMCPPLGASPAFSMFRREHFDKAIDLFGTTDFDRLFVVHALDKSVRAELCLSLAMHQRIHWMTVKEVVADLFDWYQGHQSRATLRNTLVGDFWHLLIGYCGLEPR